jgi:hypothetical protein
MYIKLGRMKTRTYTKKPFLYRSLRLPEADIRLWVAAAGELGVSQADFLRSALREKARQILIRENAEPEPRPAA